MYSKKLSAALSVLLVVACASLAVTASPAAEGGGGNSPVSFLFQVVGTGAEYAAGSDGDDDVHDGVLTLTGVPFQTMAFSNRPAEVDGSIPTAVFVASFLPVSGPNDNSFAEDPPASAFSCVSDDGDIKRVVFELMRPTIANSTVTFDVNVLYVDDDDAGSADLDSFTCSGLSTLVVDSLDTYEPAMRGADGVHGGRAAPRDEAGCVLSPWHDTEHRCVRPLPGWKRRMWIARHHSCETLIVNFS